MQPTSNAQSLRMDADWDFCSCATPEMCGSACNTSEAFGVWMAEQKALGIQHQWPVRAFRDQALNGTWFIKFRLDLCECDMRRLVGDYNAALKVAAEGIHGGDRLCDNIDNDIRAVQDEINYLKDALADRADHEAAAAAVEALAAAALAAEAASAALVA